MCGVRCEASPRRIYARQRIRLRAAGCYATGVVDETQCCLHPQSARAMQDGVCLALLHFLQQLRGFQCGRRNDLDTALFRLR
jgi:hypothetical protein